MAQDETPVGRCDLFYVGESFQDGQVGCLSRHFANILEARERLAEVREARPSAQIYCERRYIYKLDSAQ